MVIAGLSAATLDAQSVPRPAVDVRQVPTMARQATPADFNGDGRPDLIAGEGWIHSREFGRAVVRLGNGDGTFGGPLATGVSGDPVTVGDFNGDRRMDAVVVGEGGAMWILPGRGNGTFDAARPLDDVEDFRFARSADIDDDGILDLVIGFGTTVEVQPGGGDFTFGPVMALPPGNETGSSAAEIGDLNGDGRLDIVVAQAQRSIIVYLNRGGLLFEPAEIRIDGGDEPEDQFIFDLAAADLDADGDLDLVVPHTREFERSWLPGGVQVLLGEGDGTFYPAVHYETGLLGPRTVATGDFNRDGRIDVAIGSRSHGWDDLDDYLTYCDSINIFPGLGDGRLAPAVNFRLDNFPLLPVRDHFAIYQNTQHALTAADVNRDGHLDLVSSPGAIVVNRPAGPNRPPTADAGPDLRSNRVQSVELSVRASDPDWDWLRVEWRFSDGSFRAGQPVTTLYTTEDETMTVTVTDGRGGSASDSVFVDVDLDAAWVNVIEPRAGTYPPGTGIGITWEASEQIHHMRISVSPDGFVTSRVLGDDVPANVPDFLWENTGPPGTWQAKVEGLDASGNVLAFDISDTFTIRPPGPDELEWPWQPVSIGSENWTGSASSANGVFTIRGAGTDVWGTQDHFYAAFLQITGDVTFTARVASVEGPHPWTKVGLMIRQNLSDDSIHHFLLASLGKGLAYQRRVTTGGTSQHTSLGTGGAPVVYRIIRRGTQLTLQMAASGSSSFTTVATTTFPAGNAVIALVTSGHDATRVGTGRFDSVQVSGFDTLPSNWTSRDIGTVGAAGSASESGGRWTVRGSGADVWGTADEFHYASRSWTGDFDISTRVASVENVNRWTKAGLMIRDGNSPGAPYAFLMATPGTERGVAFQGRIVQGQAARTFGSSVLVAPPVYLRLTRRGHFITAYYRRSPTDDWSMIAGTSMNLSETVNVGFAVSSHVDGRLATAVFDSLSLRPIPDWHTGDIGETGIAGSTTASGTTVQLRASGADIWGTADAFRYRFAQADENASLTVRVARIEGAHAWTKAGLMIRESLDPGARHVMLIVSPGRGVAMQYRAETNGETANAAIVPGAPPKWLRIERVGHTFHGSVSNDGSTWTLLAMVDVPMRFAIHGGLVLTSHDNTRLATATFDNIVVR